MADRDTELTQLITMHLPQLVRLLDGSTLSEIDITLGDMRVTVRRKVVMQRAGSHTLEVGAPSLVQQPSEQSVTPEDDPALEGNVVTAPMVGTVFTAASPGASPFVQVGDFVEPGQVIGIIEAMKVMNEIESEFSGQVARMIAKNQQPVEFGEPLMVIAPE